MSIVGTISASNGNLTSTLTGSDILNPTLNSSYSDDYQLVDVIVGKSITIQLSSFDFDTYLQLINADTGEVISENDDEPDFEAYNSELNFVAIEGINYIVRASSISATELGSYDLQAYPTPTQSLLGNGYGGDGYGGDGYGVDGYGVDGYGGDNTLSVVYGDSVIGNLTNDDSLQPTLNGTYSDDYELIDVVAGQSILIQLLSFDFDTYLQLIDADTGEVIAENDEYPSFEASTSGIEFVATEGVNYLVRASSTSETELGRYELFTRIIIPPPDLNVDENIVVPPSLSVHSSTSIDWTVENIGEGGTDRYWYDRVYLSDDEYYDGEDLQVAYSESEVGDSGFFLPEGESYSVYSEIKIPNTQTGLRYLLFVTDTENWVYETDETNNVHAVAVNIDPIDVDLNITATAPTEIIEGESLKISWTVNNSGSDVADSNVTLYDRIYLSDDSVLDDDDPQIEEQVRYSAIASGSNHTFSQNITLSDSVKVGSYYLFFVADDDDNQYETDETNNIDVLPIKILPPDINLTVTDTSEPFQTNANNEAYISVEVTNTGTVTTEESYWRDRIYWSTDEIYDSSDIELDVNGTYINRWNTSSWNTPLASGDTYTKNRYFSIPDVESGTYYVLYKTDADALQRERDETDNLTAVAVEVLPSPNLTITSTSLPEGYKSIAGDSIDISWTVHNSGNASALGNYWYDEVFFSEDEYLDTNDIYVINYYDIDYSSPFSSGDSYTIEQEIDIPNVEAKNYYLIFYTDSLESQGETDEKDNIKAVSFEITDPANLIVSDAKVSAQVDSNYSIPISWEVKNIGKVSTNRTGWYDRVYLSTDAIYDDKDREVDSQYRKSLAHNILEPGENYKVERTITLDENIELGNYYLLFVTDDPNSNYYERYGDYSYGCQAETDETDNVKVVPIEVIKSNTDLSVTTANAPNSGGIGETIAVDWTVINQGSDDALASSWRDQIYLSDDPYFDKDEDDYLAYKSNGLESALAAGSSYTNERNITIPNTKAGNRYLLFISDGDEKQGETDETNNVYAHPFEVKAPNLEPENIGVTARTNPGQTIRANWRVRNTGEVGILSSYNTSLGDYVYLSTDDIFDEDEDVRLSYNERSLDNGLGINAFYNNSSYLRIPENLMPGDYHLLFIADRDNVRHESNEVDNVRVRPLEVTELPNLTIVDAYAPDEVTIHEPFEITWKAKNIGSGDLLTTGYTYDYIYVSDDESWSEEDVSLASPYNFASYNILNSGDEYSQSKDVTLHNLKSGSRYLLFVADGNKGSKESDESDNVTAVPIEIIVPDADLAITSTENIPLQGNVGSDLTVSWSVSNLGTEVTKNYLKEKIYFSEDNILDRDSDRLLDEEWLSELAEDTSQTINTNVTLPNLNPGNYYLFIVSDSYNAQAETDETNNVATIPFELIDVPNLVVQEDTDTPSLASVSETISVSWSVANTGNDTATSDSFDRIYLSKNPNLDGEYVSIGTFDTAAYTPLAVGDNYRLTEDVTLPQTAPGNYYLLFYTDYSNRQAETDETDNVRAVPIELQAPNLEITDTTDLSAVTTGEQINLSMTVTNTGDGAVFTDEDNGWHHNVYISDDEVFDYGDRRLWKYDAVRNLDLAPGESYTIEAETERIPQGRIGNQYLLFVADDDKHRIESNEEDNIIVVPIEITAPNLTVTNPVAYDWAGIGQTIPVSWTVTNTGNVSSVPGSKYWKNPTYLDQVFVSSDTELDDSDTPIPGIYNDAKHPLAAGDSYTIEQNITLPSDREGELYLLFKTDVHDWQGETDETDNVKAVPIFITDNGVNLQVTDADVPESATLGETIAVNWTTTNVGGVSASLDWIDRVYLSDDPTWSSDDADVTEQATGSLSPLAAGKDYDITKNITLPLQGSGTRYLIFQTDDEKIQIETDDPDNTYVAAIEVLAPNLTLTNPLAPETAVLGESIDLSWTINNIGDVDAKGSWWERVYISDDQYHDSNDEILSYGNTSSNLAANSERTITDSANVPRTKIGDRYLLFVVDPANAQGETNEADNVSVLPIQLTALDVDLVVSDIVAPNESFAGEEVEVVWTVTNNGSDNATSTWTDSIYLAANPSDIQHDEIYGSFEFTGTVAAGESVVRKQKITLPQDLEGNFNLVVKTDVDDRLIEYGFENNNTTVRAETFTSILPTFANLQVTNVTAPNTAFSSQSTVVEWTVTNVGDAATSASHWQDSIWLSLDRDLDGFDELLDRATNVSYLNTGDNYSNSLEVDLPQGIEGDYYFIVQTDSEKSQVFEFENEDDNAGVSNASEVKLTPPPDLQVTVNAPSFAFSGDYAANLSWTVTNAGNGRTLQSGWYDEVFLSTDTVWNSSDISLGRQTHRGILEPGESYTVSDVNRRFELPEGIDGDYYFIVRTDAGGQVYESALSANNFGVDETVTKIALTPPPDLEISIDVPDTTLASHELSIDYSVTNYGSTPTPYGSWFDTFYLSEDEQLDADDLMLKVVSSKGTIDIGDSRNRTINLTVPDGIDGNYYFFAETDTDNNVYELDNDNNTAYQAITIESKPADLAVSEVTVPSVIEAGKGAQISWQVNNQGTGDTVENNWNDQLWLTLDSVIGNSDDYMLDAFTHRGLLQAGESYTRSELITIPFNLQGNYQLYIQTDRTNQIYEAGTEANNISTFVPFAIARETPYLQVTGVTAPLAGTSSESITVEWSVANSGTGKTNSNYWYDEVFLSLDSDLGDSDDISLGKVYHSGSIEQGESYIAEHTFKLPQDLDGDYRIIVRTDTDSVRGNLVLEALFEDNNETASEDSIAIALNSLPDLAINSIDAPAQGISGQTFDLSWTIKNQGVEVNDSWTDVFYLSTDQVFDRSEDIYLGTKFNYQNLVSGAEVAQTKSFEIPQGLSGRFYVFGITDRGEDIYEREGENNNIAFDGNSMNVILPSPADLVAKAVGIPTDGTPGQNITINYTVNNEGDYTVNGNWEDAIYLSEDDRWDINDRLIDKVRVYDTVESGDSYSRTVSANLPGVATGNYHVIVRSDIRDVVTESNGDNNIAVSTEQINVDVPFIEIGTSVNGMLSQEQEAYYRVDVSSGETLQFVLDSLSNDAVNELYVSYGKMPTRADFDFGFEDVTADQDIVVPLSKEGTYYILARGQYVPETTQNYYLSVNTIDFGITDIETTVGDNGGAITFAIEGAKFNSNLTAALENEAGQVVESSNIWYDDSTKVFATFDLKGAAIGDYNLKVSQPSIEADFVENEAGEFVPILREITLENTLEDGFEVIPAQKDDLLFTIIAPNNARPGDSIDIALTYANNGTHDLEAPLLHLKADHNISLVNIQDGDDFVGSRSMTLLGISNEGAAGVLRPGEIGTIRLRGQAGGLGTINLTATQVVDDGSSLDYEQFIEYLGGDLADPAWASAETALKEQFGASWSSFASGLASLATQRSASGVYSHSVSELWSSVALDAWSDSSIDSSAFQVESSSNIASANLVRENTENSNFDNNLNTIPEPELLEDTQNPFSLQSVLKSAEQIIRDGAAVIRKEYGAINAAKALEKFVGRSGLELPPSESYELLQEQLGESDLENPEIFDQLKEYIRSQIRDEWLTKPATVFHTVPPSGPVISAESTYIYDVPYDSTFHNDGSDISNAIKNSSSYQSKVINNISIKDYIETKIEENNYRGNNDLSDDPIYINNNEVSGVFGNSNDFNYFDQKKLIKSTLKVLTLLLTPDNFDSYRRQRYREQLNESVLELNNLHNQYFGTTESAELALLMGRTPENTRQAKVNSINIEEAGCHVERVAYTAEIDFFIFDGTTFGADDAPKDEQTAIGGFLQSPILGLANFFANPFGGEDYFNRDNINNLTKIGPALGLGWDVQQFGYGQPHFNLVKIEDTITGSIPNPNHRSNCDDDDDDNDDVPQNPPTSTPFDSTPINIVVSNDPNDILGPEGFGEEKWINVEEPIDYTIRFENDPELASAPAQFVRITQQLDSDLDFRTFRVGDFGFGDTFVDVPDNRAFYQTRLDLVEEKGIYLDVFAGIDIATGEAFWELHSIDPETGEQPIDPLLGFLPPNLTKPEGDGFVSYSIRTDRDIETGAVIDAEATIIFDNNEPIYTPAIFNTIDVGKPISTIEALLPVSDSEEFTIVWSGSDDVNGSAIADYTIYVAENEGKFIPWLSDTTLTEATFTGTPGSTYEFYAVARDNAGNFSDIPTIAQAETTIAGGNNAPVLVNPIEDLIAVENTNFSFTISDNVFIDSDIDDVLSYTATLTDGTPLPDWLTFDESNLIFTGIPGNSDLGTLNIELTATDSSNEIAVDIFALEIQNAVEEKPTSIIGEFGKISNFNHKRQTIEFDNSYENPVIFGLPLSRNGGDPATVRITDIQSDRFTAYLQEPQYKDGWHKNENFSYLVVEAGEWELSNGALLEVGTAHTRKLTTEGWLDLDFDTDFEDTPAILSQVQTYNGNQFVRTRQKGASADGFRVSMEEEEALKYSGHATEKIGWLAIETGSGNLGDLQYQAGHTDKLVNHRGYTLNFESSFESEPSLFASLASFYGGDSAGLRYKDLNESQVRIILEEEQSLDAETAHVHEIVDFLAVEGTGDLLASVYEPVDFS